MAQVSGTGPRWDKGAKVLAAIGAGILVLAGALVAVWMLSGEDEQAQRNAQVETMKQGRDLVEATEAAGGSCAASGAPDRSNCLISGLGFQYSPGAWVSQAGHRERECQTGSVAVTTQVLTNTDWVVYADDPDQLEQLRAVLDEHGAPAEIKSYCDWELIYAPGQGQGDENGE